MKVELPMTKHLNGTLQSLILVGAPSALLDVTRDFVPSLATVFICSSSYVEGQ